MHHKEGTVTGAAQASVGACARHTTHHCIVGLRLQSYNTCWLENWLMEQCQLYARVHVLPSIMDHFAQSTTIQDTHACVHAKGSIYKGGLNGSIGGLGRSWQVAEEFEVQLGDVWVVK